MLSKAKMSVEKEDKWDLGINERGRKKWSFIKLRWWTLNALSIVNISTSLFVWLNTASFPPTKPVFTLNRQAFYQWECHIDGLGLAAFSSLFFSPTLPDSWQDFVMEICYGQNSTETLFPAFICHNDFMVRMKTESERLFGNSHASVCAWYLWSGVSPRPRG